MLREVAEAEAKPGIKFNILEKGDFTIKRIVHKSNPEEGSTQQTTTNRQTNLL